nr:hypothetical protein [Tanacetum cinerariifolium]
MIGFLKNKDGIGSLIRYLCYASSLLDGNMSKYSIPISPAFAFSPTSGPSMRGSSFFLINSINIMSPSSPFMQINSVSDEWGTKPSDSKNELSFYTFSVTNEIDGSGSEEGLVLMFFGLSLSSCSFSSGLLFWDSPDRLHLDGFCKKKHDLGSIGEETDKTTTLHQSLLKNSLQCLMTLESNFVNQTPVEVDNSDMEEEDEVEVEEIEEEEEKKNKLCETIRKNISRICLITDGWTSGTKKSYMALTGHFIDNNWNLVKKVLNFCRLDGHRGIDIEKGVENCLNEWGFTNILSISVDNESSNDNAIGFMKLIFEKNDDCLLSGEWLHIRCATHVVKLIVQDGIKHVGSSIESIRCAVKWIKKSGTRIEKFNKYARSARCESTKSLVIDCPTRWNSTYNMLEVAHEYKDAFARYDLEEVDFGLHIVNKGHSVPRSEDWVKAKRAQLDCDIHGVAPTDKHLYLIVIFMLGFWYTSKGKLLVVPVDLSDPITKSNHGFLGVDSDGRILYGVALFSEHRS